MSRSKNPPSRPSVRLNVEALEAREVPAFLGELDPTFGRGGISTVPAPLNIPLTQDAAVDALRRTVIPANLNNLSVTRVNSDGTPDATFGTNGTVEIEFGSFTGAAGIAVDATGSIVVVGQHQQSLVLARLTPHGALDSAFGIEGKVVIPPPAGY